MGTATFEATASNTTDAEFRDWGSKLSAALATAGLVKTADTGQINWTTVLKPNAAQMAGYEIWRFNDTLQATAPVFIKIQYGASNQGQVYPALTTQLGKGSNGSGTLTTPFGSEWQTQGATSTSVPTTSYVYAGEGSFAFSLFPKISGSLNQVLIVGAERSLNASGVPTATTVNHWSGVSISMYTYASAQGVPGQSSMMQLVGLPMTGAHPAAATTAPVFQYLFTDGVANYWSSRLFYVAYTIDTMVGVPVTVTGRGTYLPLGQYIMSAYQTRLMKWQ